MHTDTFSFGYIPDLPDNRDFKFKAASISTLPESVDLREYLQPVKNQGKLGACTAFATTAMVEYVRNKQGFLSWDASPLFTYYSTRKIENTLDIDSGAYVRDALKSAVNDGVAKETSWPYIVENFTITPPVSVWEEAEKHQALTYYRLDQTKENILGCLADGYPFTFGARLYQSFINTQCGFLVHNYLPMPVLSAEKFVGGHCMLAVGYSTNNNNTYILARNSWSTSVGLDGYHNIPLDYFLDSTLSSDFWTIRSEEKVDEDIPTPTPTVSVSVVSVTPTPAVVPIVTSTEIAVTSTPAPIPMPTPVVFSDSVWKKPHTYFMLLFVLASLLFFLLK